jgi:23S rRNA (adenine-N6)-dimethyltransferase
VPAGGPARRGRELGQHDLIDERAVGRLVDRALVARGDLVLDIGAGHGPITAALVARGARVVAVELDRERAQALARRFGVVSGVQAGGRGRDSGRGPALDGADGGRIEVVRADALRVPLPRRPFSVVANPPFAITTPLLRRLLGRPDGPLQRADLVLQRQAARRLAVPTDAAALAWAPWWELEVSGRISRRAFRPHPPCDAAVLTARRRPDPLLPPAAAPAYAAFVAANVRRWGAPDRGARWWARRFRTRDSF